MINGVDMRSGPKFCEERGLALVEVLVAALILGIATVGLAQLFSSAQIQVVAQGDDRVALYLAQAQIETLRAALSVSAGMQAPDPETLVGGAAGTQTFTRRTCVRFVDDTDPESPPSSPPNCNGCPYPSANCTGVTKRVWVMVTPKMAAAASPVTIEALLVQQKIP